MRVYRCDRCRNIFEKESPYNDGDLYLTKCREGDAELCDDCRKSLNDWFYNLTLDELAHSSPQPSEPREIKSPMYRGSIDYKTGLLTIYRDDDNGTLSYNEIKDWLLR